MNKSSVTGAVWPSKIWYRGATRLGVAICAALVFTLVIACDSAGKSGTDGGDPTDDGTSDPTVPQGAEIAPQWDAGTYTAPAFPAIDGVNWATLNTGSSTAYLTAFEKEAIAWYNLAKVYPQKFYTNIQADTATAYAKNTDLQTETASAVSAPSKSLILAAREYASLYNSTWEFDCNSYDDGVRGFRYVDEYDGFFGMPVDLENGGSPKLLVAKVVRLCGEWKNGTLAGITRQGNYGIFIISNYVDEKASLPDVPSYDQSRIDGESVLTDFTDNGGARTLYVRQMARSIIGTGRTDSQTVSRVNSWLCDTLIYGTGNNNASRVLAYATVDRNDPSYWTQAVCEGYARTMVGMLREVGVRARTIAGHSFTSSNAGAGGAHGWVQVYVDGTWSMCDPTWDDGRNYWIYKTGVNGDDVSGIAGPFIHSARF
jgi:hypothetical protein